MLSIITGHRPSKHLMVWGSLLAAALAVAGCDKVPLLAPSGSTVTLSANTTIVQANGTAEIRATVLESSGTPVQNGTTVTFSSNLGTLSPNEARTVNGVATVQFVPNGQSGTAKIVATSGNAKADATSNPLTITVGAAAAGHVQVTANPNRLGAGGGTSTITAVVTDTNGNPLTGVVIAFSTDVGSLSSSSAVSDSSGQATTKLTTTKDATVTATTGTTVGTGTVKVTVGTLPDITIAVAAGSSPVQGQVVTFTVAVTSTSTATDTFTSVVVNFGDGQNSGNIGGGTSVQHVYNTAGTFTATVVGTSASGDAKQSSTVIVIQPMLVTLSVSKVGLVVTLTATVSPSSASVASYFWEFGDGNSQTTANNTTTRTYVAGTYTARVTATASLGQTASSTATFTVP